MVVGEVMNVSTNVVTEVVVQVGKIALWMQTLGIILVLWITFQIITIIFNRKRRLAIYEIRERIEILDKKVNRLIRLNKK